MTEAQKLMNVVRNIRENARGRRLVLWGRNVDIQARLERAGFLTTGVFSSDMALVGNPELNVQPYERLKDNSCKFYIIIPNLLQDGGVWQREIMENFGYLEYIDYVFYQEAEEPNYAKENLRLAKELKEMEEVHHYQNQLMLWYLIGQNQESMEVAKRNFFKVIPKATGVLRDVQFAGKILLYKLAQVCQEHNIKYWISFGTLLGAVRHEGFIPWDDDTDVCMLREDVEKFKDAVKDDPDFFLSEFYVVPNWCDLFHCFKFKFRKEPSPYNLDIFVYDYCKDLAVNKMEQQARLKEELARDAQEVSFSKISQEEKNEKYKELLNYYLERSRNEIGTSLEPAEGIIWALDNFKCPISFQGNCAASRIDNPTVVMFENLKLNAPQDPEPFLMEKYKDIFSLPSDMLSHRHYRLSEKEKEILREILMQFEDIVLL